MLYPSYQVQYFLAFSFAWWVKKQSNDYYWKTERICRSIFKWFLEKSKWVTQFGSQQEDLSAEQTKILRLEKSLLVINELEKWIFQEIKNTLPKSQIAKAMAYAYTRWDALSAYLYDGNLQIDNNQYENAIRPCCLGLSLTHFILNM